MKKPEFKKLIKEVIGEMEFRTDPDIVLYNWIQKRLSREWRTENIEALQTVASMIEKEKGDKLKQQIPIQHSVD